MAFTKKKEWHNFCTKQINQYNQCSTDIGRCDVQCIFYKKIKTNKCLCIFLWSLQQRLKKIKRRTKRRAVSEVLLCILLIATSIKVNRLAYSFRSICCV